MRKALSEYYSETENDPQLVDTLTNAEGDNLVASLSVDYLQVRQRKPGFTESFQDYMIDMQTMVRPLNNSAEETLRIIKENCKPNLRIFLRAYKVSDLDALMILADEYE